MKLNFTPTVKLERHHRAAVDTEVSEPRRRRLAAAITPAASAKTTVEMPAG